MPKIKWNLPKPFKILLLSLSLSGCEDAPVVEVCVLHSVPGEEFKAECVQKDGHSIERSSYEIDKYIAIPYQDALDYFRYCKRKGRGK